MAFAQAAVQDVVEGKSATSIVSMKCRDLFLATESGLVTATLGVGDLSSNLYFFFETHSGEGRPMALDLMCAMGGSSLVLSRRCSLPDRRRHAAPLKSPATMSTC